MDLSHIKNALLKHQQICSKILTISAVQVFSPELISPVVSFLGFFIYIRNTYFQEHLRVFVIHVFYSNVSSDNLISFFLCFFKKSDALYLFPTNRLLSIVIDKFTIIELARLIRNLPFLVPPSTLGEHIYRVSVILRKGIFQISSGCLPLLLSLRPILQIRQICAFKISTKFYFCYYFVYYYFVISVLQLFFQKNYSY